MNESKYPKSLSILLALNLCLLMTMLILSIDEIGDGARFVSGMTGMQSIVMSLGLGLMALPKAKGKRRGMLGMAMAMMITMKNWWAPIRTIPMTPRHRSKLKQRQQQTNSPPAKR